MKTWELTDREHEELWNMLCDFWHEVAERRGVDCEWQDIPAGGALDVAGHDLTKAYEVALDVSMNGYKD